MLRISKQLWRSIALIAIAVSFGTSIDIAAAQPEKPKIVVAYASSSGAFAAFWAAQEKGYFKDEGLQVELLSTRTTVGLMALNSGQIDAIGTGCAEFFEANRNGYSTKVIANLLENNIYLLATSRNITDAKMLVGKTIAVNQIGDTGHLSVRAALRTLGVDPDNVTYVQVGSTPERFSAVSNGAVAGAVQAGSLKPLVLNSGMNVLIDLQQEKAPSCLSGIGVSQSFLNKYPKTAESLLRAIVKGNAYLSVGSDDELRTIFSKFMKLPVDDNQLLLALKFFAKDAHSRKPKMTIEAAKAVMAMMSEVNPAWRTEDPANYVDLTAMERLDASGFLDAVYHQVK